MDYKDYISNLAIDYLMESPVGEELEKVFGRIEKAQEIIYALNNSEDDSQLKLLRIGTILSLAICGKMFSGKGVKDFSEEDWKDIASKVAEYGILPDGRTYTAFVFKMYAEYIDLSVKIRGAEIKEDHLNEIVALSDELKEKTKLFQEGNISEPDYVDDCLWISFDAMIKLLSAYKTSKLPKEYGDLIVAVCDLSVQFGRYKLYEKENALLDEYIKNQHVLSDELKAKYDEYIKELEEQTAYMDEIITKAFNTDFRKTLKYTVVLAEATGVDRDKILDSVGKVDDFFM